MPNLSRTAKLPLALVATAAIVLSPALMLSMRGGTGYCFFVVFVLSLYHLARAENRLSAAVLIRENIWFCAGLFGLVAVVLFQILALRTGTFPELDPLLRLTLAIPSCCFLASLPSKLLRQVQWGFVAGALGAGAWALYLHLNPSVWPYGDRIGNFFTNPIPFGDTALLLGFLSIASLSRGGRASVAETAIKLIAAIAGCYASYLSGTRGGWVALPLLLWTCVAGRPWFASKRARLALGCAVIAGLAILGSTNVVRERVAAIGSDVRLAGRGDRDTSLGERLDLWRAATLLYVRHPIWGVGRGRLEPALRELARNGEAPSLIVNGRGHSDFFSTLAETGTVGVAMLLLLYAGTFHAFWRHRLSSDPDIALASCLGIALVGSTIIFGLTIDVFTLVMNVAFFALTAVTLLAWIEARRRELRELSSPGEKGDQRVVNLS